MCSRCQFNVSTVLPWTLSCIQSLQFSAVSEDSLNMAVQLAKRDLKKQKEENSAKKQMGKKKSGTLLYGRSRSPGSPSRSHTKITHSKQYKDKLQKRAQRDKGKVGGVVK